jgi:hypothetical protein
VKSLLEEDCIKEAFKQKEKYHIIDGAEYFLSQIEQYNPKTYNPTNQDIIFSRRMTTGAPETQFYKYNKNISIKLVERGGRRNERKMWMNSFDSNYNN